MLSVLETGEKIAVARKIKNLSQAQLAKSLAVSPQAVGKWERGESMPDIVTLGKLAEILGVDLNYLGGDQEVPVTPLNVSQPDNSTEKVIEKPKWNMSGGNWVDADFSGLHGLAEKFSGANIENCKFVGSELSGLILKGNNIKNCDFTLSNLQKCRISGANLERDIFVNCDFTESEFFRSNIKNCDFSGADLSNILSKWSSFNKVKLSGANLTQSVFKSVQFTDIVFDGEITNFSFESCDFTRVEFNGVIIRNTFFKNCNLKRVQFIGCRADNLSYAFMKSCKADLSNVEMIEGV